MRHCATAVWFVVRTSVLRPDARHRPDADDRLPGAAGKHDHAAAAERGAVPVEDLDGLVLVVAQVERRAVAAQGLAQAHGQRTAIDVAPDVLDGPAELDERPLDLAPVASLDGEIPVGEGARRGPS